MGGIDFGKHLLIDFADINPLCVSHTMTSRRIVLEWLEGLPQHMRRLKIALTRMSILQCMTLFPLLSNHVEVLVRQRFFYVRCLKSREMLMSIGRVMRKVGEK